MTTNREWLDYLAQNAPDELAAWFDAEHAESPTSATMQQIGQVIESTVKRGVYGDTESESEDSREKLEADVFKAADDMEMFYNGERFIDTRKIIGWLDRQAAITERETMKRHELFCETCEAESDKQIAELTAERDELQEQLHIGWECECRLQAERERYRSKFGKCLDYADAIHALMDDEGMA